VNPEGERALDDMLADSVRADLRSARAGATVSRTYTVFHRTLEQPIGHLIEAMGGAAVAHWTSPAGRVECFANIEAFHQTYPAYTLAFGRTSDSARLRSLLLGGTQGLALTPLEMAIVQMVAQGRTNNEIAHQLDRAESTIKNRVSVLFQKFAVIDRTQLALKARDLRLLPGYDSDESELSRAA
jgi:DNA-binding NarL/FixJ family response regulator